MQRTTDIATRQGLHNDVMTRFLPGAEKSRL